MKSNLDITSVLLDKGEDDSLCREIIKVKKSLKLSIFKFAEKYPKLFELKQMLERKPEGIE